MTAGRLRLVRLLAPLALLAAAGPASGFEPSGGGEVEVPVDEIGPEQRKSIREEIQQNIETLVAQGLLQAAPLESAVDTLIDWPLRAADGLGDPGYHGISNFYDNDASAQIVDYQCQNRSYDGHKGIDFFTWPFWWNKMDREEIEIVAGAPGTIVLKWDGNFDRSCSFGGTWNAVAVRHADNRTVWYGHMKNGSLTSKAIGDTVFQGEFLGLVGSSGSSTGPHLHLEFFLPSSQEPNAGPCGAASSLWLSQPAYYDSAINLIATHSAPPEFPTCSNPEVENRKNVFQPGETVHFVAYYRDQQSGQQSNFSIRRPDGSVFQAWNHASSEDHYAASYWRWQFALPSGASLGTWEFEVTFEGATHVHEFAVGSFDAPLSLTQVVSPNPPIAGESANYTISATNVSNSTIALPRSLQLSALVPAQSTFVSASDGGNEGGGTITWPSFDLASGESLDRDFEVLVDPGSVEITSIVSSDVEDMRWEFTGTTADWNSPFGVTTLTAGPSAMIVTETTVGGTSNNVWVGKHPIADPGNYNIIRMRIRQDVSDPSQVWSGRMTFTTDTQANHTLNTPIYNDRPVGSMETSGVEPSWQAQQDGWAVLTWDVSGASDWTDAGSIEALVFNLSVDWDSGSNPTPSWEVDWASISSGAAWSAVTTHTLTTTVVPPPNSDPTLVTNAGVTVLEGGSAAITSNELEATDPDAGQTLSFSVSAGPANGSLNLGASFTQGQIDAGALTYTHDGGENTSDAFPFTVSDGEGGSTGSSVFAIIVTPVNDPPVAMPDALDVDEAGTATLLTGGSPSVLSNDSDAESDPLTALLSAAPSSGSLSLASDGTFSYTHNGDETLSDSFSYRADDGTDDSDPIAVSITVNPVNDPPVIQIALPLPSATVGTPYSATWSTSDPDPGDSVSMSLLGAPAWMTGPFQNQDGSWSLGGTPLWGDQGLDSVTLHAEDSASPPAAVELPVPIEVLPAVIVAPALSPLGWAVLSIALCLLGRRYMRRLGPRAPLQAG